jgi:CDGSH-type Zn-finger protein
MDVARHVGEAGYSELMENTTTPTSPAPKMCGCGKTKNPQGHCDGSHAQPARKMCACGKTKDPQGYCDGSHAK